jgi:hypothetical protein
MLPNDRLLRTLAVNAALGAVLGLGVVATLLGLNTAGLRRLILGDAQGHMALSLLSLGFVVMCSSIMMGTAVMRHGHDGRRDKPPGGRAVLVRVSAKG